MTHNNNAMVGIITSYLSLNRDDAVDPIVKYLNHVALWQPYTYRLFIHACRHALNDAIVREIDPYTLFFLVRISYDLEEVAT